MKIKRVTLAATHVSAMVAFYNAVCGAGLTPFEAFGGNTLYRGTLDGLEFIICPNDVAGVEAQQNRQQFQFEVGDISATLKAVNSVPGALAGKILTTEEAMFADAFDPDGNTLEFVQMLTEE